MSEPFVADAKVNKVDDQFHLKAQVDVSLEPFLEIINLFSAQCDHITEFGVGSQSSSIILMSGKPKKLISYDFRETDVSLSKSVAKQLSIDYQFFCDNTLNIEIEKTDLLYIDTQHTYTQLLTELKLHSHKVRKYIICHDTFLFREFGEEPQDDKDYSSCSFVNTRGLINAIREFMQYTYNKHNKRMWKMIYDTMIWPGLIVLERKLDE